MPLVRRPDAPQAGTPLQPASIPEALTSPVEDTRWMAARAAAGQPVHSPALVATLRSEPSARVREALLTSLSRMSDRRSVTELLPLLRSDDAGQRAGVLDALRIMMGNARELLPSLLADSDVDIRILSCELVRPLPGAEATALLCERLQLEQDANACAAALDVLAEVGNGEALPVLASCAARFRDTPFLGFAIAAAAARISAQGGPDRG